MDSLPHLRVLLENLPERLYLPDDPESGYNFQNFCTLSPLVDQLGQPAAAIEHIRIIFRAGGGDILFDERGPGLEAIVDVFEEFLGTYPDDENLEDLVEEVMATAKGEYTDAGLCVRQISLMTV
jgi:hypothetical protein